MNEEKDKKKLELMNFELTKKSLESITDILIDVISESFGRAPFSNIMEFERYKAFIDDDVGDPWDYSDADYGSYLQCYLEPILQEVILEKINSLLNYGNIKNQVYKNAFEMKLKLKPQEEILSELDTAFKDLEEALKTDDENEIGFCKFGFWLALREIPTKLKDNYMLMTYKNLDTTDTLEFKNINMRSYIFVDHRKLMVDYQGYYDFTYKLGDYAEKKKKV